MALITRKNEEEKEEEEKEEEKTRTKELAIVSIMPLPAPPTPFVAAWPPVPRHVFSSSFPRNVLTLNVWCPALPPFPVIK